MGLKEMRRGLRNIYIFFFGLKFELEWTVKILIIKCIKSGTLKMWNKENAFSVLTVSHAKDSYNSLTEEDLAVCIKKLLKCDIHVMLKKDERANRESYNGLNMDVRNFIRLKVVKTLEQVKSIQGWDNLSPAVNSSCVCGVVIGEMTSTRKQVSDTSVERWVKSPSGSTTTKENGTATHQR